MILSVPVTPARISLEPLVVQLAVEEAAQTLAEIESGLTARSLLPWVPLMAGGGDEGLIKRWKELATGPDLEEQATLAELALVFAELTPGLVNWQQLLEGWSMQTSKVVEGWQRDALLLGEVRARRDSVLEAVRIRLCNPVPEPIRLAVQGTNDPDILKRWHALALSVNTSREFAAGMVSES